MCPFIRASCFASHLVWISNADFRALVAAFAAGAEPEDAALSPPARAKLTMWRAFAADPDGNSNAYEASERVFAECAAIGADVVHPEHFDYPAEFARLEKPPVFLARIGGAPWRERPTLSIFGARDPSPAALRWMDAHLPEFLARLDVNVASGGARGVDRRAHALSIASGRPTVVFLPSGIARPFPRDLGDWFARVRDGGGAVLSEHPPGEEVRKKNFERRNRMIAALGAGSFAVEGRRRSGTTMTAGLVLQMNRELAALPGAAMDPRAAGTLDLLHQGAALIRDALDLQLWFESVASQWRGVTPRLF